MGEESTVGKRAIQTWLAGAGEQARNSIVVGEQTRNRYRRLPLGQLLFLVPEMIRLLVLSQLRIS